VKRQERYPAGTKVKAFAIPVPRIGEMLRRNTGNPETWKPALTKLAEAEVSAEGVLTFTIGTGAGEVPAGKPTLLWAEVGGKDAYLETRTVETAKEPVA
jgi:hypothetical protein